MSALLVIYRFPLIQNKTQIGIHKQFNAPTIKAIKTQSIKKMFPFLFVLQYELSLHETNLFRKFA